MFDKGHKAVRIQQAEGGVTPADKCLNRFNSSIGESGLGLVVQDKLVSLDGLPELTNESKVGWLSDLVGTVANHTTVLLLGDVHGDIGVLKQFIDVGAVLGCDHESDTRVDREREPADANFVFDDSPHAPQDLRGVGDVRGR